jgi:hypothetical protein
MPQASLGVYLVMLLLLSGLALGISNIRLLRIRIAYTK